MRLRLYEDAVKAKSRKTSKSGSEVEAPSDSGEEPASGAEQEASVPAGETQPADGPPTPSEAGIGRGKGAGSKTRSQKGLVLSQAVVMAEAESTPYAVKLRTEMVHRVLEGLRDEAFELARDIGIESLTGPGGLDDFINRMREVVFPRATEEARELFRAGQRQGTLARQAGESMLSYVSRRRRWWKLLKTLDSSIELSEPMRVELLLELSGLTRQESLVIKACAQDIKSFESVARTLIENYSGVHLREGRTLGGGTQGNTARTPWNRRQGTSKGPSSKSSGKGFTRRAYPAIEEDEEYDEEEYPEEDSYSYYPAAYPAMGGHDDDNDPDQDPDEDLDKEFEDYELDESEATALNAMEELEDSSEGGHAIQLMLAANAAFGKARGKNKGKSKGKGKGKGKVVRSNLTLEQRRDKLRALKAKSKCLRCGGTGHWAGDPECKFPTNQGGKGAPVKRQAHVALIQGSASDGIHVGAGAPGVGFVVDANPQPLPPNPKALATAKAKPGSSYGRSSASTAVAAPPGPMEMAGGDRKFYLGQRKRKTFEQVSHDTAYVRWAKSQADPSNQLKDFLTWFDRYYLLTDGDSTAELRASLGIPPGTYEPRPKKKGPAKKPPNPPLEEKCRNCKDFTYSGSSVHYVRVTCRDCGHMTQKKREETRTHDPETCPHTVLDRRGSSRSVSRTFCRQCGTFVDEVPAEFQKQRRDAATSVLNASADVIDTVGALTAEDASADLDPAVVESIMGRFNEIVVDATLSGERINPVSLHRSLREAVVSVMEEPPGSPDSWQPVAMMGLVHSRGESPEGRQIRIEDARPNSSWPAIRAWPQIVRSLLAHNREQMLDITLEALRTQGADAVDEALTRRERQQYYEYFEYFTPRAVRVNEAFRDDGVDYDEWVIRNWRQNGRINPEDLDSDEERAIRIPQLIPVRPGGDPSSSSATRLRELLAPPARVYDDPAFDFLDRNPYMTYRRHIQVEAEEDAARGSQEPEPGLDLDEPDSGDEPRPPRPPRVTVLNLVQPQDVDSETSSSVPDIDLFEGYSGPNPLDGTYMPSPNQPFAAAAQEEEEEELDEVDDTHTGPERATRRPRPTGVTRRQVALREEHAISEPDGHRAYEAARRQANMAISTADVVAVDNIKMVDMWSPSEKDVYGAVDEGCNATCHSKAWGRLAEDKLKGFNLSFPWMDATTKSFAGLGATTKTLGKRKLPFCLSLDFGCDTLAGIMESHEVNTEARNPLLISLFAQATLGLVKNMRTCTCFIGNKELELSRCVHTGLLLINLTAFKDRSEPLPACIQLCVVGEEESAPKSRSALVASSRTVMAAAPPIAGPATRPVDLSTVRGATGRPLMAPDVRGHDMALAQSYNGLRWDYRLARDGLDPLGPSLFNDLPDVIVVSAGAKRHFQNYRDATVDDALKWRRILPEALTRERSIKVVDLRQLHDESKGALGSHTGRHPGIISQLLASKAARFYLNDEYKFIRECVERGERVLLLAFCISNRHRSVAFATCMGAAFWPMPVMVIHLDTYVDNNWSTMRCGGRCDQCGERFQSAASATALHNQAISHLSPAALGPMMVKARAASAVPVRTAEGGALWARMDVFATLM